MFNILYNILHVYNHHHKLQTHSQWQHIFKSSGLVTIQMNICSLCLTLITRYTQLCRLNILTSKNGQQSTRRRIKNWDKWMKIWKCLFQTQWHYKPCRTVCTNRSIDMRICAYLPHMLRVRFTFTSSSSSGARGWQRMALIANYMRRPCGETNKANNIYTTTYGIANMMGHI